MSLVTSSTVGNLLLFGLVFLLIKFRIRGIGTSKRRDPFFLEVPGWPLLGQLPAVIKDRTRPLEFIATNRLKHGPGFSITFPGTRIVDVSKPEWIEYIQKTNFDNYTKGDLFRTVMSQVFGEGIFVVDGPKWKLTRHSTSTIFTNNTFKKIIVPSTNATMDEFLKALNFASEENRSLDFCDLFFSFTLDAFVKMTLGKDLELFKNFNKSEAKSAAPTELSSSTIRFVEAFDFVQNQMDFRFSVLSGWKLIEMLNLSMGKRMKESCQILNEYTYSLIDDRISHLSNKNVDKADDESGQSLLDLFIKARDQRGGNLGRIELRDSMINLIIAGRDTTAQALSWAFFHLLMNRHLISKIRDETIEILGDDDPNQGGVSYENYKEFIWAYAVVLETLRLHPSVPKNMKVAISDDQIPGGPFIQSGDFVRWCDWLIGRDVTVWGSDCTEFKPERWIDEKGSIKQFGQFKFHAFNGGPRVCLGMNLALYEAVKVIVEIFQRFELEFAEGWLENVPKMETIEGIDGKYPTPMYRSSLTFPMKHSMMISVQALKN